MIPGIDLFTEGGSVLPSSGASSNSSANTAGITFGAASQQSQTVNLVVAAIAAIAVLGLVFAKK